MSRIATALATSTALALGCAYGTPAAAQQYYIGSVFATAANFCPQNTASAEGQTMSIANNDALFALYGTTYGGDGQTTFALPDLRAREIIGASSGAPGRSPTPLGSRRGVEQLTLTTGQMAAHTHLAYLRATTDAANATTLIGNTFATAGTVVDRGNRYSTVAGANFLNVSEVTLTPAGSSQPIYVRNPYLGIRYCVVLYGIFPQSN